MLDVNDGCNTLTGVDAGGEWSGGISLIAAGHVADELAVKGWSARSAARTYEP
jgi:hypothetical protein